jgi:hypothetical protein
MPAWRVRMDALQAETCHEQRPACVQPVATWCCLGRQQFKFERVCVCVCACVTLCVVARRHGPASGSWTEALNKMLVRATV